MGIRGLRYGRWDLGKGIVTKGSGRDSGKGRGLGMVFGLGGGEGRVCWEQVGEEG